MNKKINVGFKRLNDSAIIPTKAHESDSGFDLVAAKDVIIEPGETKVIPTGIAVVLPEGYEAQVRPRSGVTSKSKLRVQLGTIDNAYRGEVGVIVDNIAENHAMQQSGYFTIGGEFTELGRDFARAFTYKIRKGDRIAQLVVQALPSAQSYEVDGDLGDTDRGSNGFGSSGVNVKRRTNK